MLNVKFKVFNRWVRKKGDLLLTVLTGDSLFGV